MDIEILIVVALLAIFIAGVNFVLVRLIHLDNTAATFVQQAQDSYWEYISGEHGRDDLRSSEDTL